MGRRKGPKTKTSNKRPVVFSFSPEERIRLLANLVIDRIIEDQKNGKKLFSTIKEKYYGTACQD